MTETVKEIHIYYQRPDYQNHISFLVQKCHHFIEAMRQQCSEFFESHPVHSIHLKTNRNVLSRSTIIFRYTNKKFEPYIRSILFQDKEFEMKHHISWSYLHGASPIVYDASSKHQHFEFLIGINNTDKIKRNKDFSEQLILKIMTNINEVLSKTFGNTVEFLEQHKNFHILQNSQNNFFCCKHIYSSTHKNHFYIAFMDSVCCFSKPMPVLKIFDAFSKISHCARNNYGFNKISLI